MDFANPTSSRRQESPLVDDLLDDNQADSDIVTEDSGLSRSGSTLLSDLSANGRIIHADFHTQFVCDFFDDQDLS
jgi:hypothetical protein